MSIYEATFNVKPQYTTKLVA